MITGGNFPAASVLTKDVREERKLAAWLGDGQQTASLRWLGRRPEGPGAETLGKEQTQRQTNRLQEVGEGPLVRKAVKSVDVWIAFPAGPRVRDLPSPLKREPGWLYNGDPPGPPIWPSGCSLYIVTSLLGVGSGVSWCRPLESFDITRYPSV